MGGGCAAIAPGPACLADMLASLGANAPGPPAEAATTIASPFGLRGASVGLHVSRRIGSQDYRLQIN